MTIYRITFIKYAVFTFISLLRTLLTKKKKNDYNEYDLGSTRYQIQTQEEETFLYF